MKRFAAIFAITTCAAFGFAGTAWANHPIASGVTKCARQEHVITWRIAETHARMTMTIDSASVVLGTTTYTVSLESNKVAPNQSVSGTTIIPGNLTGAATLTVAVSWPSDRSLSVSASVDLSTPCTTTSTTTPTTTPPTTVPPVTTPTTMTSSTTTPGSTCGSAGQLACTGSSNTVLLTLVGSGLALCGGGLWVLRRRPSL